MNKLPCILLFISAGLFAQTNYYVDNTGTGDTLSTISEVNALTLSGGDSVFFKFGHTWRDELNPDEGGGDGTFLYFGTKDGWGNEADGKPEILGSDLATSWTETSTGSNIWYASETFTIVQGSTYGGLVTFEFEDSIIQGWMEMDSYAEIDEMYEWFWESATGRVYVYCEQNPDTYFDEVEVPQRNNSISVENVDSLHFKNFRLAYDRLSGIRDRYDAIDSSGNKGMIVENCEVCYIGFPESQTGYGIYLKFSNMWIHHNDVHHNGRRNFSYVTTQDHDYGFYVSNLLYEYNISHDGYHGTSVGLDHDSPGMLQDVIVRNNLFYSDTLRDYRHDRDLTAPGCGLWVQNNYRTSATGGLIKNVHFYNNIIYGNAASHLGVRGADSVFIYNNSIISQADSFPDMWDPVLQLIEYVSNIYMYNNVFRNTYERIDGDAAAGQRWTLYINDDEDKVTDSSLYIDYNIWWNVDPTMGFANADGVSYYRDYTGRNDTTDWRTDYGYDVHSIYVDPQLKQSDFTYVGETSPLKTFQTNVDWPIPEFDYYGNERSITSPTVGAVEYDSEPSTATDITALSLAAQTGAATINTGNHTVSIEVVTGTNVTSLSPTISVSSGATIDPTSGTAQNFTSPVTYTVTAEDAVTEQEWTVTVTVAAAPSPTGVKNIYTIGGVKQIYWIDSTPYIITVNE